MDKDAQPHDNNFCMLTERTMDEDAQPPRQPPLHTDIDRGTTWMKMLNPSSKVQAAPPALSQAAAYLGVWKEGDTLDKQETRSPGRT